MPLFSPEFNEGFDSAEVLPEKERALKYVPEGDHTFVISGWNSEPGTKSTQLDIELYFPEYNLYENYRMFLTANNAFILKSFLARLSYKDVESRDLEKTLNDIKGVSGKLRKVRKDLEDGKYTFKYYINSISGRADIPDRDSDSDMPF